MILPPLDESIRDKVMLFKAERKPIPMPTDAPEDKKRFQAVIRSELPAFACYLVRYRVPENIRASRFGVMCFHHPEVLEAVNELSPERRLLELIDVCIFPNGTGDPWKGKASELEKRLRDASPSIAAQTNKLLYHSNSCGTYLTRLAGRKDGRITPHDAKGYRVYKIKPPDC